MNVVSFPSHPRAARPAAATAAACPALDPRIAGAWPAGADPRGTRATDAPGDRVRRARPAGGTPPTAAEDAGTGRRGHVPTTGHPAYPGPSEAARARPAAADTAAAVRRRLTRERAA